MTRALHLIALTVGGPHLADVGERIGWAVVTVRVEPLDDDGPEAWTVEYQPFGRSCFLDGTPDKTIAAGGYMADWTIPAGEPGSWSTDDASRLLGDPRSPAADFADDGHPWEPLDCGPADLADVLAEAAPGLAPDPGITGTVHYAQFD